MDFQGKIGIPANQCYLNADMLVKFGLVIRIK